MDTKVSYPRRLAQYAKRCLKWLAVVVFAYLLVLLVGLVPVNADFSQHPDGIEVYIVSNAIHADIIVPVESSVVNWSREFKDARFERSIANQSHVAFGWGDRGFFLETETWEDFETLTAANALLVPSSSCVHVNFTRPEHHSNVAVVKISEEQYQKLVEFIRSSFRRDSEGKPKQIDGYAYSTTDAFFDGQGRYHLLNTCNSWVGRGLVAAEVKAPWLSPLPQTPTLYLEAWEPSK